MTASGNHAGAIAKAEAALACRPEARGYVTLVLSACATRNAAKANAAAAKITGPGQRLFVGRACAEAGVQLAGFDPADVPRRRTRR